MAVQNFINDLSLKDLSFEEAFSRLEQTVASLEKGNTSLDDCVRLFEEATRLRQFCEQKLAEAKMRVEKVIQSSQGLDFQAVETAFEKE